MLRKKIPCVAFSSLIYWFKIEEILNHHFGIDFYYKTWLFELFFYFFLMFWATDFPAE